MTITPPKNNEPQEKNEYGFLEFVRREQRKFYTGQHVPVLVCGETLL
ncbi:hypothetical protein [Bacteroides thetaiotaomicron]